MRLRDESGGVMGATQQALFSYGGFACEKAPRFLRSRYDPPLSVSLLRGLGHEAEKWAKQARRFEPKERERSDRRPYTVCTGGKQISAGKVCLR